MYIRRNFTFSGVMAFSGGHLVWLTLWGVIAVFTYIHIDSEWLSMPWFIISLVGVATAFYVGFKNNSSYDRMWEARKIWGAIVNDSRSFAMGIKNYVNNQFTETDLSEEELAKIHKRIFYRHIAWLYTLRKQLLVPAPWEHLRASRMIRRVNEKRLDSYGVNTIDEPAYEEMIQTYLTDEERSELETKSNKATHLIEHQAAELKNLRKDHLIDDFRIISLQETLQRFYDHQGKCERIKNFPLPRQYASMSFYFVSIFIFLLPFGIMPEMEKLGGNFIWMTVPLTVLVGWIFIMMELVGDYSENPFEGLGNDIPMMSLCRTIEIDLREMINDDNIPEKVKINAKHLAL